MPRVLRINRVAVHRFAYDVADFALDYNGLNHVYKAGNCLHQTGLRPDQWHRWRSGRRVRGRHRGLLRAGRYASLLPAGPGPTGARTHLQRPQARLEKHDRMGIGPVDIALWDIAGKVYDAALEPVRLTSGRIPWGRPRRRYRWRGRPQRRHATPAASLVVGRATAADWPAPRSRCEPWCSIMARCWAAGTPRAGKVAART